MPVLLANNATSRLASSISPADEQVVLSAGDGSRFPALAAGQWFPLTLINPSGEFEIVRATARSGDVVTVTRGQEGTQPRAFDPGDRVELRLTTAAFGSKLDTEGGTVTGPITLTADLKTWRPASPETGVVFLGQSGTHYLYFDGTSYQLPAAQLVVNGSAVWHAGNFNPASYLPLSGGTISGGFQINSTSPQINLNDTDWGMRYLHANGGLVGFLTSSGGWACYSQNDGTFIASANIGAYSDRKHKKRIRTIKSALALIERLRGVRYVDKRTGAQRVGVIAQEVREELPEVVGEGPDGLHVDYGNMVGVLIPAIQELHGKIKEIEKAMERL